MCPILPPGHKHSSPPTLDIGGLFLRECLVTTIVFKDGI
jgi:hypothetical protein